MCQEQCNSSYLQPSRDKDSYVPYSQIESNDSYREDQPSLEISILPPDLQELNSVNFSLVDSNNAHTKGGTE